jgi:hypothetical protein
MTIEILIAVIVVVASAGFYVLTKAGEMLKLQDEKDEAED